MAACYHWTQELPDRDGWWWHRHIVASTRTDQPIKVVVMSGNTVPSAYWYGRWKRVTDLPRGHRFQWSDRPIDEPAPQLLICDGSS